MDKWKFFGLVSFALFVVVLIFAAVQHTKMLQEKEAQDMKLQLQNATTTGYNAGVQYGVEYAITNVLSQLQTCNQFASITYKNSTTEFVNVKCLRQ